jgi:hypothetical protein
MSRTFFCARERVDALKQFARAYPLNRFVFACRDLDYDPSFRIDRFALASLDDARIADFLKKSYGGEPPPPALMPLALRRVRPDLLSACRNPFRLRMLISYYNAHSELPADSVALYSSFVSKLLSGENSGVSWANLESVLSRVALAIADQGLGVEVARTYIEKRAKVSSAADRHVLKAAEAAGILRSDSGSSALGFEHQRLQEYFAACALADAYDVAQDFGVLEPYVESVWAHEIVLAVVAQSAYPGAILRSLLKAPGDHGNARLLLAADCVAARPDIDDALIEWVSDQIVKVIEGTDLIATVKAMRALAAMAPDQAAALLPRYLDDPSSWIRETALELSQRLPRGGLRFEEAATAEATASIRERALDAEYRNPKFRSFYRRIWLAIFLQVIALVAVHSLGLTSADILTFALASYFILVLEWGILPYLLRLRRAGGPERTLSYRLAGHVAVLVGVMLAGSLMLTFKLFWIVIATNAAALLLMRLFRRWYKATSWRLASRSVNLGRLHALILTLGQVVPPVLISTALAHTSAFERALRTAPAEFAGGLMYLAFAGAVGLIVLGRPDELALAKRGRTSLEAVAETAPDFHGLLILDGSVSYLRIQAIRELGHRDYERGTLLKLKQIAERDREAIVRDAAAQAIEEIQARQRREGRGEGLDVRVNAKRTNELDFYRPGLAVVLLCGIGCLSAGCVYTVQGRAELLGTTPSLDALRGVLAARVGWDESAKQRFESHLTKHPDDVAVRKQLGWLYAVSESSRDADRALVHARRAVELTDEHDRRATDLLAEALLMACSTEEARRILDLAAADIRTAANPAARWRELEQRALDARAACANSPNR